MSERRYETRLPVEICVHQYLSDVQYLGLTRDLSETGLYVSRLAAPGEEAEYFRNRPLQLEFALPGTGEMIWATGQVRYNEMEGAVQGLGIRLTAMASRHQRALRDYVETVRKARLRNLLLQVQRNRISPMPGLGRMRAAADLLSDPGAGPAARRS